MSKGRSANPNRQARTRFASVMPVGTLSMFPGAVEVARRHTNELPAYREADPVVYLARPYGRGPTPPADLFYLVEDPQRGSKSGLRVYIKEVIDDA